MSRTISFLRFPLTVGVVFIHSDMGAFRLHYLNGSCSWLDFVVNLGHGLTSVCVPCFFIISGFLMFYHSDFTKTDYIRKIKRRWRTLCVPYLIWNFIGFTIFLIKMHPIFSSQFPSLAGFRVDIEVFLRSFWEANLPQEINIPGPIDYPLWYLRDLIILTLLSPIIYNIIKKIGIIFVLLMGVIWLFQFQTLVGISSLSGQSLFFFPLGAYLGINKINFVDKVCKVRFYFPLFISCQFLVPLIGNAVIEAFVSRVLVIIGCIAVFQIAVYFQVKYYMSINSQIEDSSFFVYALHGLLITKLTNGIIWMTHIYTPFFGLLVFLIVPIITIMICLFVYNFLQRQPYIAKILTGDR